MELDQIVKRLEWLDDEHRKDKTSIATLESRIIALEGGIPALSQQIKDLSGEITRIAATLGRLDQFDASLAQTRVEFNRSLEGVEKARTDHEREVEKVRRVELEGINKAMGEIRKGQDPIPDLRKGLQTRQEEDIRLGRLIEEVEKKVVDTKRYDEEYKRSLRLIEEGRRQDSKRLTDLDGEVVAVRKRVDEQRGKIDMTADGQRKLETRQGEIQAAESERRQSQAAFIEKQTMLQVERERTWKEWLVRFETVEKVANGLDTQWQAIDATHRSVKKSQEALDETTQRFERRLNEITEMQRLTEDRFRQDWVTFKADDQKRWNNYTLSAEEQQREVGRQFDKLSERLVFLEDLGQELQDLVHQANEEAGKRLQGLLALAHEYMTAYENVFGRPRVS
jgi:chromosome segregation ATPase